MARAVDDYVFFVIQNFSILKSLHNDRSPVVAGLDFQKVFADLYEAPCSGDVGNQPPRSDPGNPPGIQILYAAVIRLVDLAGGPALSNRKH